MNKELLEFDLVDKAHKLTHQIHQPSWAAHCMALSINLDEAAKAEEAFHTRPTIRVKTPPYDYRATPICGTPIPTVEELLDLEWDQ